MAIHAKPKEDYAVDSDEWTDNVKAFYSYLSNMGYSVEAISGMLGNSQYEGGMNPWRYQDDKITGSGYGLFQYTPKAGYLDEYYVNSDGDTVRGYGYGYDYYAPNKSVEEITSGAEPTDAYCQLDAIERSGKYFGGGVRNTWIAPWVSDYENYTTLAEFKTVTDVEKATYLWLGFFEVPDWWQEQDDVENNSSGRRDVASKIYDLLTGTTPTPPTPSPVTHKMNWIFYLKRRYMR